MATHCPRVHSLAWAPCGYGIMDEVTCLAFSPDGKSLASGARDGTLRLWDVETGNELRQFDGTLGELTTVTFAPDGANLFSAARDTVTLWDVATGKARQQFAGPAKIRELVVSEYGNDPGGSRRKGRYGVGTAVRPRRGSLRKRKRVSARWPSFLRWRRVVPGPATRSGKRHTAGPENGNRDRTKSGASPCPLDTLGRADGSGGLVAAGNQVVLPPEWQGKDGDESMVWLPPIFRASSLAWIRIPANPFGQVGMSCDLRHPVLSPGGGDLLADSKEALRAGNRDGPPTVPSAWQRRLGRTV